MINQHHHLKQMGVAALLISTSSVWVRLADMGPTVVGFYRMAIGGLCLLLLCLWQKRRFQPTIEQGRWLLLGAVFFAADLWFWHRSIHYIGPGLATVLGNFQVFFMTLFGYLFLKERIGWRFLLGLMITVIGLFFLVGIQWSELSDSYRLGVFWGLATAVAYTGFMLSLKHAQSLPKALSPAANLGVLSILCALMLWPLAWWEGDAFAIPNWTSGLSILALGVLCQVVGWVLITRSMPHLGTAVIGLLLLLQPSLSMVWDVVFFDRPLSGLDVLGMGLVLVGIYLAMMNQKSKREMQ